MMLPKERRYWTTLSRMGLLALIWGSVFLWIKLALNGGFTPIQIAAIRCALGALVLGALCLHVGQRMPRSVSTWRHLFVAAFFCNALPFFLLGVGEQTVDSGLAGVLQATTPLWSFLIAISFGSGEKFHPVRVLGLVLGFMGTMLIFAPWQRSGLLNAGALAVLAAAASYAIAFAYMGRNLVGGSVGPLALSAAQLVAATALCAVPLPVAGHVSEVSTL